MPNHNRKIFGRIEALPPYPCFLVFPQRTHRIAFPDFPHESSRERLWHRCALTVDTGAFVELIVDDHENMLGKGSDRGVRHAARVSKDKLVDSLAIFVGFGTNKRCVVTRWLVDELDVGA